MGRKSREKFGLLAFLLLVLSMFIVPLLAPTVQAAAEIHGTLYDLDLEKLDQAVIEISTTPKQRVVSSNGDYAFNVEKGSYVIKARYKENATMLTTEERIVVDDDGSYVFDLFLLPSFENEDEILTDIALDVDNVIEEDKGWVRYAIFSLVSLIFFVVLYLFYKIMMRPERRKKKEEEKEEETRKTEKAEKVEKKQEKIDETLAELDEDHYSKQVISILEKHEGRATQKDIRKDMPVSEAKTSLVLTDLENSGKIRKIKKGRGNIIILNNKANNKADSIEDTQINKKRGDHGKKEEAEEESKQEKDASKEDKENKEKETS